MKCSSLTSWLFLLTVMSAACPADEPMVRVVVWDGLRCTPLTGLIWKIGAGQVFYFRPGHEMYPVYKQELPLQVITNAVTWFGHSTAE